MKEVPEVLRTQVTKAVDTMRRTLAKQASVNIRNIEVLRIEPASSDTPGAVADRVIAAAREVTGRRVQGARAWKKRMRGPLRQMIEKSTYVVTLRWTFRVPESNGGKAPRANAKLVERVSQSSMLFDTRKAVLVFDTMANCLPIGVRTRIVTGEGSGKGIGTPDKRMTLDRGIADVHEAVPGETRHYRREIWLKNIWQAWYHHSTLHYEVTPEFDARRRFAANYGATPNDFKVKLKCRIWWEPVNAWGGQLNWGLLILGEGGTINPPGQPYSFSASLPATVPGDCIDNADLHVVTPGSPGVAAVDLRVSISYAGPGRGYTGRPYRPGDNFGLSGSSQGNAVEVKQATTSGTLGHHFGLYRDPDGYWELATTVKACESCSRELAAWTVDIPIAIVDAWITIAGMQMTECGVQERLRVTIPYIRSLDIPEPAITCRTSDQDIKEGETTQVVVTVRNASSAVTLKQAKLSVDDSSIEGVLQLPSGANSTAPLLPSGGELKTGESVDIPFTLEAMPAGQKRRATPSFTLSFRFGEPVPVNIQVNPRTCVGCGQEITVAPIPPQTGSVKGIVVDSATGVGIQAARVTIKGADLTTSALVDGTYVIEGVPPGKCTIRASHPGYNQATRTLKVSAGETRAKDLLLRPRKKPSK